VPFDPDDPLLFPTLPKPYVPPQPIEQPLPQPFPDVDPNLGGPGKPQPPPYVPPPPPPPPPPKPPLPPEPEPPQPPQPPQPPAPPQPPQLPVPPIPSEEEETEFSIDGSEDFELGDPPSQWELDFWERMAAQFWDNDEVPTANQIRALLLEFERRASAEGGEFRLLAVAASKPGTLIGTPYACPGSHCPADLFNRDSKGRVIWQNCNAVDIALVPGTAITACMDGKISTSYGYGINHTSGRAAGWRLHLEHDKKLVAFYQHNDALLVPRGKQVKKGDFIARSGWSGWKKAGGPEPHLHFAVTPPYDPRDFAKATYDLINRQPPVAQPPSAPGAPPPLASPAPGFTKPPADIDAAWTELMSSFAHGKNAAIRTMDKVRDAVRDGRKVA
jgi:peptidase M23-like protein